MWWIIIIIGMIIGAIYSWRDEDFTPLMCIVFIAFIIVLLLGGLSSCFQVVVREYEEKQYNIQGLENNITTSQKTSGAFVLGFGYINSETTEQIKYYYFKVNDIGKQLETIEIGKYSNTYIRETNEIEPCLIYRYQETKNKGLFKWLFGEEREPNKIAEILVVPENTIKIEYNVEI